MNRHKLCRKVEKEIDWKDEVVDCIGSGLLKRHESGFMIGGAFVPALEMRKIAHLVASLTDKPE